MTLLEEIQAKCTPEEIASKEHGMIAAKVSVGRVAPNNVEIGHGLILETLGLVKGNLLLSTIYNSADFVYVKPLLEQGRLKAASPLVGTAIQGFVSAGLLTEQEGNSIISLGYSPAPVSVFEVIEAMKGI